jgi:lipoprotein Spr
LLILMCLATIGIFSSLNSYAAYPANSLPQQTVADSGKKKLTVKDFLKEADRKELETGATTSDEIIASAMDFLGVPHCMGGTTRECIDCSGLLFAVFSGFGIKLPHGSQEQAWYGHVITGRDNLVKGDLVFFKDSYLTSRFITHSGIYIGDNRFIHASASRGVVITSMDDPYWQRRFVFGTRVLER